MAINIFKRELKSYLRSVVTWSLSVTALVLMFLALFPSFSAQAATLNAYMANFPPQLRDAFGLNLL